MTEPSAITKAEEGGSDLLPVEVAADVRDYVRQARSSATQRAYRADWRAFVAWCEARGLRALPAAPETVAGYVASLARAGRAVSGVERALAAISEGHRAAGFDSPRTAAVVREAMKGIRRAVGVTPRQKDPITPDLLRRMVESLPEDLRGTRDRALLLLGFAGAFRRSELVALDVEDVAEVEDGLRVTVRRSKTDQEGRGLVKGIPRAHEPSLCATRAVRAWVGAAGVTSGPLFREITRHGQLQAGRAGDRAVARIVKRAARTAGLDPSSLSGHSLRAGLVTAAARAGKTPWSIMRQTGHRSEATVRRYVREAGLFTDNAATGLL